MLLQRQNILSSIGKVSSWKSVQVRALVTTQVRVDKSKLFDVKTRPDVKIEEKIEQKLKRGFPVMKRTFVRRPPEEISNALEHILYHVESDVYNKIGEYYEAGKKLRGFLESRIPPVSERRMSKALKDVEKHYREKYALKIDEAELNESLLDKLELETEIQRKIRSKVNTLASNWKAIDFNDKTTIWAYLLVKTAFDYAAMHKVLSEINLRKKTRPRTILDFGSGIGSSIWAATDVFGPMTEVFAVDTSPKMNDFARLILQGGSPQARLPSGYFFRLHLPEDDEIRYDLVTCSFTLLELPSETERLRALNVLWKKTEKYLVLIEEGTNSGFQVLSEARHHLINVCKAALTDINVDDIYTGEEPQPPKLQGHIFAPCPHESTCPRYFLDDNSCKFPVTYQNFYFNKMPKFMKGRTSTGVFSYMVFRKGTKTDDCLRPRLVEEPKRRHNHIICRFCASHGKFEEVVAVKSKENEDKRTFYKYAKQVHWGDQIRATLIEKNPDPDSRKQEIKEANEIDIKNSSQL